MVQYRNVNTNSTDSGLCSRQHNRGLFAAQISQNGPKNAWDSHDSLTIAETMQIPTIPIALFAHDESNLILNLSIVVERNVYKLLASYGPNSDIKNPFKENRTFIDTKVPLKEVDLETIDSKDYATRF